MRTPPTSNVSAVISRVQIGAFVLLGLAILIGWTQAIMSVDTVFVGDHNKSESVENTSLLERLPTADVLLIENDKEQSCGPWTGSRFSCGAQRWQYVGYTMGESGGKWAPCIWAHPHNKKTLRIRFPDISLGSAIGGNAAFIGNVPENGAAVHLDFRANNRPLGRFTITSKKRGWESISIPTDGLQGKKVTLEIDIHTRNAGRRWLCIDPVIIDARKEDLP